MRHEALFALLPTSYHVYVVYVYVMRPCPLFFLFVLTGVHRLAYLCILFKVKPGSRGLGICFAESGYKALPGASRYNSDVEIRARWSTTFSYYDPCFYFKRFRVKAGLFRLARNCMHT